MAREWGGVKELGRDCKWLAASVAEWWNLRWALGQRPRVHCWTGQTWHLSGMRREEAALGSIVMVWNSFRQRIRWSVSKLGHARACVVQ